MYSLRRALIETHTTSARGLQAALGSRSESVRELIQIALIHTHYLAAGGALGPLGWPIGLVVSDGNIATREYRGGAITVKADNDVVGHKTAEIHARFVGFRCIRESHTDQWTSSDEPYFVVTVGQAHGVPITTKIGPFSNVNGGTEQAQVTFLADDLAPNPTSITVAIYENDHGDSDETAKQLQEKMVELTKQAESLVTAADAGSAADGPGIGEASGAATASGIVAGPIGALAAFAAVELLGLGDDFVGTASRILYDTPGRAVSPPAIGKFLENEYNIVFDVDGQLEGRYEVFLNVFLDVSIHEPL